MALYIPEWLHKAMGTRERAIANHPSAKICFRDLDGNRLEPGCHQIETPDGTHFQINNRTKKIIG